MDIVRTVADVRTHLTPHRRSGRRIGLVPTMGYLHAGHMELVRRARAEAGVVVASLFVNPLQFGPREDLSSYPRDFDRDRAMLAAAGVDLLFAPDSPDMYPQPQLATVEVAQLGDHLCGRSRPGHFRGVATVVAKLFNIVQPDIAYFGEKDAQQLAVIRRMVADLNFAVTVVGVPTVREADGLAMSSRNTYLTADERRAAPVLKQALAAGETLLAAGSRDLTALRERVTAVVAAEPLARIDYVEVVDADTLQPLSGPASGPGRVLVALAIHFGRARLIDNATLEVR